MMEKVKTAIREHKKITACIIVAILLFGAGVVYCVVHSPAVTAGNGTGSATSKTAMNDLEEGFAACNVTKLADIKEAKTHEDPVAWLTENSQIEVDEDAITKLIDSYKTGAESSAQAMGMDYDDFIKDNLGYDDEDAMTEAVYDYYKNFVVERAIVLAVAEKKNITVNHSYYEKNLTKYAEKFGYEDANTFETECDPDSIANEMLYDKTVEWLKN